MSMQDHSNPHTDPVRQRRALMTRWTQRANRVGYLLFAAAIVLFVVAFTGDFNDTMVTLIVICMTIGSILLAPAIVLGYGLKAAEKDDLAQGH